MKKLIYSLIILFSSGSLFAFNGEGTVVVPYQLGSLADLQQLAFDVNDTQSNSYEGVYFELTQNIDLSGVDNWNPIGINPTKSFKGIINGNGKTITGLTITGADNNKGLFGFINDSQIINMGVSGNIAGTNNLGTIAAMAINSTITGCYTSTTVNATQDNAGGITGIALNSNITNCYNKGTVSAANYAGGIVGIAYNSSDVFNVTQIAGPPAVVQINSIKTPYLKAVPYLNIPSTIGGNTVTKTINGNGTSTLGAFQNNQYIEEANLPEGFLNVQGYAFYGCLNLKKINIPSTLQSIGNFAFADCTSLSGSIVLPAGFNSWGGNSFKNTAIEEVTVNSSVAIGWGSFVGCTKLKKITLTGSTVNTLNNGSEFNTADPSFQIFVPSGLVDSYKVANNWKNYAAKIVAIP